MIKIITINWKSLDSIKNSEKQKTRLENAGYNLINSTNNTLTYKK